MTEEQKRVIEILKATDPEEVRKMTQAECDAFCKTVCHPGHIPEYIADCIEKQHRASKEGASDDWLLDSWILDGAEFGD